ncbi:MAG: hypothetical protein U0X75_02735 [Acidobacteriota bacterium]
MIEIPVDAMREAEAVVLLGNALSSGVAGLNHQPSCLRRMPRRRTNCASWRARLGKWPLLLRLANGVLRNRIKSGAARPCTITYANRALDKRGEAFDANNPLERNQERCRRRWRSDLDQLN